MPKQPRSKITPCPYLRRSELEDLRKHKACGRPFRYFPGGLNTVLDLTDSGPLSKILHVYSDAVVLGGNIEPLVDGLYLIEYGPRFYHRSLDYYTQIDAINECIIDDYTILDRASIMFLGLQKLMAKRTRSGNLELCHVNNSIIPLENNKILSIGLLHARTVEVIEEIDAPSLFDKSIQTKAYRVKTMLDIVGFEEDTLYHEAITIETINSDPEYSKDSPKPHLAFVEWDRSKKEGEITLIPLYSSVQEYTDSLLLSTLLYLSKQKDQEPTPIFNVQTIRKTYKKMSKVLDRANIPKPEKGAPGLLDEFSTMLIVKGDEVSLNAPCSYCGRIEARYPGVRIYFEPIQKGSGIVL